MEMTFGKAHDIWSRVVCGDKTLTDEEVKAAAQWFDDFSVKLNDKVIQSKQELEEAMPTRDQDTIEKKRKATKSDKRQLDDVIRKYDDLTNWLNSQQ
jgi:hypothetical protein